MFLGVDFQVFLAFFFSSNHLLTLTQLSGGFLGVYEVNHWTACPSIDLSPLFTWTWGVIWITTRGIRGQYLPDLIIYFPDYSAQGPNRHLELSSADNPIIWYKNNEQITDIYVCINVYLIEYRRDNRNLLEFHG